MTQEELEKWVTSYHEAGHAVATHYSRFFDLGDPAIRLHSTSAGNPAETTLSGPHRAQWTADHARDYSMISFGGYVGQSVYEQILPGLQTRQEGCHDDYKKMTEALKGFGILSDYEKCLGECIKIIHPRIDELKKLATLIFHATDDIPLETVLTVLNSAQTPATSIATLSASNSTAGDTEVSNGLFSWLGRFFRR